jgi:pimeloyl-ACP methyl ester carboxylesterase
MTAGANTVLADPVPDQVRRRRIRVDAGIAVKNTPSPRIAAEIFWPSDRPLSSPPLAFVCLPGGGMNRRYFDLGGSAQPGFSFARQMAASGMITVAIDHLGVGDSTKAADGFDLTPDVLVAANASATSAIVEGLRLGTLIPGLQPLPDPVTIGVGHSMGAMLTVMQQAIAPRHKALVLLGFSNNGLVKYLPEPAQFLIGAPELVAENIGRIARQIHRRPYQQLQPSAEGRAMFYGSAADPDGVAALKTARDVLLTVPGLQSMIPGSVAPQSAKIDVPVFLGLGDQDIAGPTHAIPANFPGSRDISLLVLPETGHCQFIFSSRTALFDRICLWSELVRAADQRQLGSC